jgi:hypothetical protein
MNDGSNLVTIRDIDVPFWRILMILIKWAIAAIPAAIIVIIIYAIIFALIGGILIGVLESLGVQMPQIPTPPVTP